MSQELLHHQTILALSARIARLEERRPAGWKADVAALRERVAAVRTELTPQTQPEPLQVSVNSGQWRRLAEQQQQGALLSRK